MAHGLASVTVTDSPAELSLREGGRLAQTSLSSTGPDSFSSTTPSTFSSQRTPPTSSGSAMSLTNRRSEEEGV